MMAEREYIENVTHGFSGPRLHGWQLAQRGYLAGFTDAKLLAVFIAVMRAESGGYLRAFHHNATRDDAGKIVRTTAEDGTELMQVRSTDLGLIQRNVVHPEPRLIAMNERAVADFVHELFERHPKLANGQESANIAWGLYEARGWQPWYAHSNGSYKKGLPSSCTAIANFLDRVLLRGSGHDIVRKG